MLTVAETLVAELLEWQNLPVKEFKTSAWDNLPVKVKKYKVKYLIFPKTGIAGGWSRYAKYRPRPVVVKLETPLVTFKGKSVYVNGIRRLRVNVWDEDGTPIRIDYPELTW